MEKFNIPKNTPVEYIVTMNNFEKVSLKRKNHEMKKLSFSQGADKWSMNDVDKLAESEKLKKRAGELFKV